MHNTKLSPYLFIFLSLYPTMPVFHDVATHLFLISYYPIPIHSIQILIAFVKTTDISPLWIPKIMSRIPKNIKTTPVHFISVNFFIIIDLYPSAKIHR